ncbi:MAG TPA: Trp family transcriptional regulator [Patescibacteria group bacterium]|nr:Trp family transcriptional regulator [Patescibacteria group bacterium]
MVNKQDREKFINELVHVLSEAGKDKRVLREFLEDLLTPAELSEVSARWQIAKLIKKQVPHHEVAKQTHTAVATVTRGSREMRNPHGGFQLMLKKLKID